MQISVLSDGGWGTAISLLLLANGHRVTLWGPFADYVEEMRETRRNDRFLHGPALPADVVANTLSRYVEARDRLFGRSSPE